MRTLPKTGLLALAAFVSMAYTSTALAAQQKSSRCTASVMPAEIAPGSPASRLSVSLSRPIGPVTHFQAEHAAGLKLASPMALPKIDMANSKKPQKPIEMANEANRLTLWLNTVGAKPGTYAFTLVGPQGRCSGKMTVASKG